MLSRIWWGLVQFGFRLLYNELAFTYDLVSWVVSLGAWRCWQRAAIKHLGRPGQGIILELAHGTGNLQLDLRAAGYQTIGYDLSPHMGRIAARKLLRNGHRPALIRGRAQGLPFTDATFPVVVTTFPTNFIVAPETLREIYRILQPGGRLIIVPSGRFTGGGVLRRILEWLYRITGQGESPQFDAAAYFGAYGFAVRTTSEPCPNSEALIIIAEKGLSS